MRSIPLAILTLCYWYVIMTMQTAIGESGLPVPAVALVGARILMFFGSVLFVGTFILALLGV